MFDFETRLAELPRQTILCVGDLMLDSFVYGEVRRISPEAPTPVVAVDREESMIGGAGNVARNIAALGAKCVFFGLIGQDEAGAQLRSLFAAQAGLITADLVADSSRPTTRKVRFVSEHHSTHLLRADWELSEPAEPRIEQALIDRVLAAVPDADAIVLSDYAKGALTSRLVRAIIEAAGRAGKPVLVDPKGTDFTAYRGAALITPNRSELAAATRLPVSTDAEVAEAAHSLREALEAEAVLVTRSEEGMTLDVRGAGPLHIPAYPVRVRDVSGAGDTVVAVMATLVAMGAGFEVAARAANAAASVVVGKRGTATVSAEELKERIIPHAALAPAGKIILDRAGIEHRLAGWRGSGHRIGFTNGCFDILHPGHIRVLAQARAACDRLVVGLNSDSSVARLKGADRPVQDQQSRAEVLAALEAVDLVVLFEEDTPLELITQVRPTVLVKGSDYSRDQVVGREVVEAEGGEVILVDVLEGHSTTGLLHRSRLRAAE